MRAAAAVLRAAGVPSPEHDARALLQHLLGLGDTAFFVGAGEALGDDAPAYARLVQRRAARVPLQHLLGTVEWGGLSLRTDARALIPRPETEELLQHALGALRGLGGPRVLDVGTGSGALALAIQARVPAAEVWATDLSADALALARENAARLGLTVRFRQGHLHAGLPGPFDVLVSNPPYLPEGDRIGVQPEVTHDPDLALYSGVDGLDLARELLREARALVRGTVLLELDPRNVHRLAAELPSGEVLNDFSGRARFLRARIGADL